MSTKRIVGDYNGTGFYHDGDLEIIGSLSADGDVIVTGTLLVTSGIKILGNCKAEKILCAEDVCIFGALKCTHLQLSSSLEVVPLSSMDADPYAPDFNPGGTA